jgi:3-phosphoshikimate 1-carboxyvinyltransferase
MADVEVPGDFSSAAFLIVGALMTPGSEVAIEGVGLNPTRIGLLHALQRMGADIVTDLPRPGETEPIGTVTVRYSQLSATDIEPAEIPALIDELPVFMLAAARARGRSVVRGAEELRVKESDRLAAMARLLSDLGVRVTEHPDGIEIEGRPEGWDGGSVLTGGDHRLAMVGAIAGCASTTGVRIDDAGCIAVSYPGFVNSLTELGGNEAVRTKLPE